MGKVICMASAKGGSGKTVLTATFATFLKTLGKKVLIIDTDASTNGLTLMYLKEVMIEAELLRSKRKSVLGIFEINEFDSMVGIVPLPTGVFLIPATFSFINTEKIDIVQFEHSIKFVIKKFAESFDYIFLDAQAGSDSYAGISMSRSISDQVVIVSEYDPLSSAGIERLKGIFRNDLTYERTWVLLNKMLPDFVKSFSDFLEVAKYLSPIPWDADVVKSYARRRLAIDTENGNEFTLAIIQTLNSLLDTEISEEIEKWLDKRTALLREPIELQLSDAKKQLNSLIKARADSHKVYMRKHFIRNVSVLILVSVCVIIAIVIINYRSTKEMIKYTSDYATLIAISILVVTVFSASIFPLFKQFFELKIEVEDEFSKEIDRMRQRMEKLESLSSASLSTLIASKNKGSNF